METTAARWLFRNVVTKLCYQVLDCCAATQGLGGNASDLKEELRNVRPVLNDTQGRDMSGNCELVQLLEKLRELTDEANDMLNELEYFRIQDELDGTEEAADHSGDGLLRDAVFHARHAACGCMDGLTSGCRTVGKSLLCCSSSLRAVPDATSAVAAQTSSPLESDEAPKLVFHRVGMSKKMKEMVEQLRRMCDQVKQELHKPNSTTPPKRPETSSFLEDDEVFGREGIRNKIIRHMIRGAKDDLSVFLIFGHGGIGKTTLAQYVYNDERVKEYVRVWICVSHDFDVKKLTRKILQGILTALEQEDDSSPQDELNQLQTKIGKKLGSKKFLLVLDDIWKCNNETDWRRLIAPFRQGQIKVGSTILATSRFKALAQKIMVTPDCKIELLGLQSEDFQKYFYTCISRNGEPQENEFKEIGDEIIKKLKGSPLAAKTVVRLLCNNLNARHCWRQVLEHRAWRAGKADYDIMPALKHSFDYLPFHLQECFSFCALFPEDYPFDREALIRFWLGAGIIDSGQNNHDIGVESLNELVDHGFLKRIEMMEGPVFVMHDLMHDLAVQVSSHKYHSINSSNIKPTNIPPLVCHLSIFIEGDAKYYEDFKKAFCEIKKTLKIGNLRTLIIEGKYDFIFPDTFGDMFTEVKGLRVFHLSDVSNPPESLLSNFPKPVHLCYLKLATRQPSMSLPKALSRFYHLKVLDLLQWKGDRNLPRYMSNLKELRHFVADEEMHCSISEVGKLKNLQELKAFKVETRNDSAFDLSQLGELTKLRGSLSIHNLEKVQNREEANNAQLLSKENLDELKLFWNLEHSNNTANDELLESLRPHSNLKRLHIEGHRGTTCPTWLGTNHDTEGFTAEQEQALQLLPSLQHLEFKNCRNLQSLPVGLRHLCNLKRLGIEGCPELRNGVAELLTQGNLMELRVMKSPNVFSADWEPSRGAMAATAVPKSSGLQKIDTDDLLGFPMVPSLCSVLSSSLKTFVVQDRKLKRFTAEQEKALQLLTSLQYLEFNSCEMLQSLPAGLHHLCNLKRLEITMCLEIRSLPKESLPSSLQQLVISCGISYELKRDCSKLRNIVEIIV